MVLVWSENYLYSILLSGCLAKQKYPNDRETTCKQAVNRRFIASHFTKFLCIVADHTQWTAVSKAAFEKNVTYKKLRLYQIFDILKQLQLMTVLFANNINLQFPMSLKHSHSLFCHSFCTISVILVLVNVSMTLFTVCIKV